MVFAKESKSSYPNFTITLSTCIFVRNLASGRHKKTHKKHKRKQHRIPADTTSESEDNLNREEPESDGVPPEQPTPAPPPSAVSTQPSAKQVI